MATWNFLVDMGFQEQLATPVNQAPYQNTVDSAVRPVWNLPQKAEQEIDLAKFGLQNQQEYELMVSVKEQWGTAEDFRFILEKEREKQKVAFKESISEPWVVTEALDIAKPVVEAPGRVVWAGISQLPSIVSNVWGFFIGKPIDFLLEKVWVDAPSLEEQFKKDGLETKEKFQEVLGIDPDDFTTDVWEFWAEIGSLFVPGGQAGLTAKFPQLSSKIAWLWSVIEKLSTKAPRTFNVLRSALTWAKEVGKFEVVSEWEVTPELKAAPPPS